MMTWGVIAAFVWAMAPTPATDADPQDGRADTALRQIETAGEGLHCLTGSVAYRKDDALLGSRDIRTGTVQYERTEGTPSLSVEFTSRVVNRRRRAELKRVIYSDGWLIESDATNRQFIKRQLARPDEAPDPMRLGGPFPMPLGQKRSDVYKRFNVTIIDGPADPFVVPKETDTPIMGLHLVPKETVPESQEWSSIDIWYDCDSWMPIGVVATETNGDCRRIRLSDVQINPTLTASQRAAMSVSEPSEEGWSVDVRPLPPAAPDS